MNAESLFLFPFEYVLTYEGFKNFPFGIIVFLLLVYRVFRCDKNFRFKFVRADVSRNNIRLPNRYFRGWARFEKGVFAVGGKTIRKAV